MTWSHIQKRISSVLHDGVVATLTFKLFNVSSKHLREKYRAESDARIERVVREILRERYRVFVISTDDAVARRSVLRKAYRAVIDGWLVPFPPAFLLTNSNPILAGAGSVFNLAGSVDEPIVGLVPSGESTINETSELLPFYADQAERILGQAEEMIEASERILGAGMPSRAEPGKKTKWLS